MARDRRWFLGGGIALTAGVASLALLPWFSALRGIYVEVTNKGSSTAAAVALTTPAGRRDFGPIEPGRSRGAYVSERETSDLRVDYRDRDGRSRVVTWGFTSTPGFRLSRVKVYLFDDNFGVDYDHALTYEVLKIKARRLLGL